MITVYGASDDLIEIDGDIREEFGHYSTGKGEPALIACSDGTVLRIVHDHEGIWRITPIAAGTAPLTHTFGLDDRAHTDKVTLDGDIRWIVKGDTWAKAAA